MIKVCTRKKATRKRLKTREISQNFPLWVGFSGFFGGFGLEIVKTDRPFFADTKFGTIPKTS
jgi:hypothetical protein